MQINICKIYKPNHHANNKTRGHKSPMIAEPFGQNGTFCSFGFLHQKSSSNDVSMDPNLLLSMSNIPKTSKLDYCYQQNEKQ